MIRRLVFLTVSKVLLIGMLSVMFSVHKVNAGGTIYIRADGSIDPPMANIATADNVTYTFTDNIYDEIVVERSHIIVDGDGYTLEGSGTLDWGLFLESISNVTIENAKVKGFYSVGIYLYGSSNTTIRRNNITDNGYGVRLEAGSSNNIVSDNNVTSNEWVGVLARYSSNYNVISRNHIVNNSYGIHIQYSSYYNVISGNIISDNHWGTNLDFSCDYNIVSENNITKNYRGIWLSSRNTVLENNITDNSDYGVCLWGSNNMLRDNTIVGNGYNFRISGSVIQDVDTSNTVNGKPIYYLMNQSNLAIEPSTHPDIGYLALVNSYNITVKGLELKNNGQGVLLASTMDSRIINNTMTGNYEGVWMSSSKNNTVSGNNITNNIIGVLLSGSSFNIVSENNISANQYSGIYISYYHEISNYSSSNTFSGNNVTRNHLGIYLEYSSDNIIYHNNLINNTQQVDFRHAQTNFWDDGYPSGGNYWSDYTGLDLDPDGIGDSRYEIDGNNMDYYPLMGMFSDFNATLEHHVQTICNSSISDFQFNGTAISFDVTGENDTTGFCRICIPRALVNETYKVFVNGKEVAHTLLSCSNSTHSYLYFSYTHSTQEVIVISEFPSSLILPLFMAATLLAVIIYRRKIPHDTDKKT